MFDIKFERQYIEHEMMNICFVLTRLHKMFAVPMHILNDYQYN